MVGIGDRGLHVDVACVGRDLGLDRGDLPFKRTIRVGVDQKPYGLSGLELAAVLLRDGEVCIERRQIRQRHDHRAGGKVLADLDVTDAEYTVEWSPHHLLRDDRFGLGDACFRLIERGLRLIDGRLRAELMRGELLGALQRQLSHHGLRLEVGEIALLWGIEQLHQRRALLHRSACGEHDVGNPAADIGGDVHLVHGGEIADRIQQIRHDLGFGLGDGNRCRRWLVGGEELFDRVVAESIESDQRTDQ